MADGLNVPADPAFWDALCDVRGQMRNNLIQGLIAQAEQTRRAYRYAPDHPIEAVMPHGTYAHLRADDLEMLSARHAIEVRLPEEDV